jgi:glycosyltransferase involved in cell wall biosynthesis
MKLSIIIPFANEFPQILFTIQSIAQNLLGRCDFEILAVDNYCPQLERQREPVIQKLSAQTGVIKEHIDLIMDELGNPFIKDKGGEAVKACTRVNPWLKYVSYTDRLSHWQAKNYAITKAEGDVFFFSDGHCVLSRDALVDMLNFYIENRASINGSIHLPVTYKVLESHRLIYKLVWNPDRGECAYSFTEFRPKGDAPFEVPCMSCCGLMIGREELARLGNWPKELGIYGGGENFLNFAMAVLGMKKWIWPFGTIFHHGEKRGYHYIYDDYVRNKIIAAFVYGGAEWADLFSRNCKGRPETLQNICNDVKVKCNDHRRLIESRQVMTIQDWAANWRS